MKNIPSTGASSSGIPGKSVLAIPAYEALTSNFFNTLQNMTLPQLIGFAMTAGLTAAGIGTLIRRLKSQKDRNDMTDIGKSRNVITVPVSRNAFMDGIPTPEEYSRMHAVPKSAVGESDISGMSPEELSAVKKNILRGSGRKVDFFGGNTSEVKAASDTKEAADFSDIFLNPSRAWDDFLDSATKRPAKYIAGGLISLAVATKIVDSVNKIRRKASEERLERARKEYVDIMSSKGSEKSASGEPGSLDNTATILGASFMVPFALSAMLTNKIMEKRRKAKRKSEQMSDSFPDDPIILYKTSEDKVIDIGAGSAIAVMAIRTDMFKTAEKSGRSDTVKAALSFPSRVDDETAVNTAMDWFGNPDNNGYLLDMSRAFTSGDSDAAQEAFSRMFDAQNPDNRLGLGLAFKRKSVQDAMLADPRFTDILVDRYTNPEYDDTFGQHRRELIDRELAKTFKKGGALFNLASFWYNNTGVGKDLVADRIRSFTGNHKNASIRSDDNGVGNAVPAPVEGGITPNHEAATLHDDPGRAKPRGFLFMTR